MGDSCWLGRWAAGQREVDVAAHLHHATGHEGGKKIANNLSHGWITDVKPELRVLEHAEHGRKLHTHLKGGAKDRRPRQQYGEIDFAYHARTHRAGPVCDECDDHRDVPDCGSRV